MSVTSLLWSADNLNCKQLVPDQAGRFVRPDQDPICLTLMLFLKESLAQFFFFLKISSKQKI